MQRLVNYGNPDLDATLYSSTFKSMYVVLAGNDWPIFPGMASFVLTFGTLVALIALIWRPRALLNFPLSISLSVVGLLAPYAFVGVLGYPPRFSIHLLPLAILSLMFFLNNIFIRFKFSSSFIWKES